MKHCPICNEDKPTTDFYRASNGMPRGICKSCHNQSVIKWQKTDGKDSRLASRKKYGSSDKGKAAKKRLRQSIHSRFKAMLAGSKNRELLCDITEEQFGNLTDSNCTYCDGPLPLSGIGLDRIDDLKGYVQGNVLPCCGECNRIRSDVYTVEETKRFVGPSIRKIREERDKKGF